MSHSYAPLPVREQADDTEMEAAFDESDSEETDERSPLAHRTAPTTSTSPTPLTSRSGSTVYDFERLDYADHPPPGSPPRLSSMALPNNIGNSNGLLPSSPTLSTPSQSWYTRFIPSRLLSSQVPSGPVGSGINNDGVFANVTAKPTRSAMVQATAADGSTHLVPEDSLPGAAPPPSYSVAQADAAPSYWDTTVHIPGFSGQNMTIGELVIDSLPTGTLLSFLWNLTVSVAFQFVGFLLTYLLHATHAARLGSRAGLGITLINYGFSLRKNMEDGGAESEAANEAWSRIESWRAGATANFSTAADAEAFYQNNTAIVPMLTEDQANQLIADATVEWLSFFLMTVGWFVLLTSVLQFFRVKRWERGIISSQLENPNAGDRPTGELPVFMRLRQAVGVSLGAGEFFRRGLGLRRRRSSVEDVMRAEEGRSLVAPPIPPILTHPPSTRSQSAEQEDDGDDEEEGGLETDQMIRDPESLTPEERQALAADQRLFDQLQRAGFL